MKNSYQRGLTLGACCALVLSLSACNVQIDVDDDSSWSYSMGQLEGSGEKATQSIDIGSFDHVRLETSADVVVQIGHSQSIRLTADDNLLDNFSFTLNGDTLVIDADQSYRTEKGILVDIEVPELDGVSIQGSGDLEVKSGLEGKRFSADIHGSGDIILHHVRVGELTLEVSGSGDIAAAGKVENLDAQVNGSGDIEALDLRAANAHVRVNGSGEVQVRAVDTLDATISGSGDIYYEGDPTMSISISGSGDVERL